MKAVIIGNHAAGLSAAEALRRGDASCSITVISNENTPPYSRCLIPYIVSGEKRVEDILFKPASFYEDNDIDAMLGVEAVRILRKEKRVLMADGSKVAYDVLIIATGGSPSLPRISGAKAEGVFGFRTLCDAGRISAFSGQVETAVVLGGGLVGLKAALALHELGKRVKVLMASSHVLSQIAGATEAVIFEEHLSALGIDIISGTDAAQILGEEKVRAVETTDGKVIDCQLVVVGKGVSANKTIVKDTDIKTEYGILVDDHCRTNVRDVYAAGDVAQSPDSVRGIAWMNALWPHAVEAGRVAAENALGKESVLGDRTAMNALVLAGLPLVTYGLTGAREQVEGGEEIVRKGPDKAVSRRLIFKDDRLMGFCLVGNVENAGVLGALVKKQVNVSKIKDQLVFGEYDFASVLAVIRDEPEKFREPAYQEVLSFF